jgi:hypothetical protein
MGALVRNGKDLSSPDLFPFSTGIINSSSEEEADIHSIYLPLATHLILLAIARAVGLVTGDKSHLLRVEQEPGVTNGPYVIKVLPLVLQGRAE